MWSKWNTSTFLVRVEIGTTTLENWLVVSMEADVPTL